MKKSLCVLAIVIALTVTSAFAQIPFLGGMPVFDATNFGNAIKRHFELVRQYEQLVLTYEQLILEYEHFIYMAQQLPGLPRHRLGWTPWRFSRSTNIYGTTGAWTSAVNTGTGVDPGYRQATEPLNPHFQFDSDISTFQRP